MTKRQSLTLVFGCALAFSLTAAVLSPRTEASAYRLEPEATLAPLDDGQGNFEIENLHALYGMLVSGASSLSDLEAAATRAPSAAGFAAGTGSADFAQQAIVLLGGKKWTPVHLTKDQDGNTILTLWLAWTEDVQPWSAFGVDRQNWQTTRQTQYDPYPMNMYSSSYIRAYLNGTSYAAQAGATSLTDGAAVQAGTWKTFLSTFKNVLVAPEKVSYQANERASVLLPEYVAAWNGPNNFDLLNEGYAEEGLNSNTEDGYVYGEKEGYSDWRSDKLWLPSLSETGHGKYTAYETDSHGVYYFTAGEMYDTGLWNMTWDQCRTHTHNHNVWLRSGDAQNRAARRCGDDALSLTITASYAATSASEEHLVRPAIHLNLSAVEGERAADPAEKPVPRTVTAEYDGGEHGLDVADYAKMNFSGVPAGATFSYGRLSATHAGTYTLNATPKSGSWADGSADPVAFTLTITPRPARVYIRDSAFQVYGETPTVASLQLSPQYGDFLVDEDIADLGDLPVSLSSRKDGRTYPLDAQLPVGTYDIAIADGVYGNYNVTFLYSAAFGDTSGNVYTVLPSDAPAILVGGYLVENGAVSVPYDGYVKAVHALNLPAGSKITTAYYSNGEKISAPRESGQYTVSVTGAVTMNFTLIIEDDDLPPEKPTDLTREAVYSGSPVSIMILKAGKMTFGEPTAGATFANALFSATNAGIYTLTASPKSGSWADGSSDPVTFTIRIAKADVDFSRTIFRADGKALGGDVSLVYDGRAKNVTAEDLPSSVTATVTYFDAEGTRLPGAPSAVGSYRAVVEFALSDPANYNVPAPREFTFRIAEEEGDLPDPPVVPDPQDPADPSADPETAPAPVSPWWWIVPLIVASAAAAGAVVGILIKRKKK